MRNGPLLETVSQSPPSNIPGRDTIIPPLSIFIHRPRRGPSIGRRRTQPKERNRAAVKHQRRCYAESEANCSPSIETGATSESTTDQPPSIGASPEYVVSPRDPGWDTSHRQKEEETERRQRNRFNKHKSRPTTCLWEPTVAGRKTEIGKLAAFRERIELFLSRL